MDVPYGSVHTLRVRGRRFSQTNTKKFNKVTLLNLIKCPPPGAWNLDAKLGVMQTNLSPTFEAVKKRLGTPDHRPRHSCPPPPWSAVKKYAPLKHSGPPHVNYGRFLSDIR